MHEKGLKRTINPWVRSEVTGVKRETKQGSTEKKTQSFEKFIVMRVGFVRAALGSWRATTVNSAGQNPKTQPCQEKKGHLKVGALLQCDQTTFLSCGCGLTILCMTSYKYFYENE